jgi:hypothetical protein
MNISIMFLCHTQGSPYILSPLFLNLLSLLSLYRDQIFDMLFRSIEQDASMNGLPQKSLHLFSHEDSIVPPEASMQAMYLYDNPRMMIRDGEHDPDDRTVDQVLQALKTLWSKKYSPPLVLLD